MKERKALVITSIFAPNDALKQFAEGCAERKIHFIVVGDSKSPQDFNLKGCDFFSIGRQRNLPFSISKILPEKKYSRKNIGYLIAISNNHNVIVETDDDNFPLTPFWKKTEINYSAYHIENRGWVNVYAYFIQQKVWPRAFPLEHVNDEVPAMSEFKFKEILCPVQQGLADENPDVDAIFRLVKMLPVKFKKSPSIALGNNTWCPFNSQNTKWFKPAFPLLYLPTYCSFRMTDIWRSFIAQRIFWTNGWSLLFHKPTVYQLRNEHNILRDFKEEIPGYLNNNLFVQTLEKLELKTGEKNIYDNLLKCYEAIIKLELIEEKEMELLEAWCNDMKLVLNN
ncbi:MAG TPA: STELLO glycosyltransferase family protein [Bacteroidia bacterium]|nr:STELLO glycosyltransferase family protein [Bacteroidia bacterium]